MREIKFRAWDKADKLMYYDIQQGIRFDDGSEYSFADFLNNEDYHEWILEQSTGLKDKNGKEIYEGDKVRDKSPDTNWWDGVVTWHKEGSIGWVVEPLPENKSRGPWRLNYCHTLEIIGNIHSEARE